MSKRAKYKIGYEEAEIAVLLRLNPDRWFTDGEIHELLGHAPNTHLGRLVQLRVVDILRIAPEPTYRWSTKADRNNARYVIRLNEVINREGIKAFDYDKLVDSGILDVRSIEAPEPVVETVAVEKPAPPFDDNGVKPTEIVISPDEDADLSAEEAANKKRYEIEMRRRKGRAKDGRFTAGNFVHHPEFGDGEVLRQHGKFQLVVHFGPRGTVAEQVVEERHVTESTAAWKRLKCAECNRQFWWPVRRGKDPLSCSKECANKHDYRMRAALKARQDAERAAAAEREAAERLAQSEVAALIAPRPVVVNAAPDVRVGLLIRKGGHVSGQDQLTVEAAIELLMDLLP